MLMKMAGLSLMEITVEHGIFIAAALAIILVAVWVLSGLKRCPKNKIMVVFGRKDKVRSKGFKPKCYNGGVHLVNPLTQKYTFIEKRIINANVNFDNVCCLGGEKITFHLLSSMIFSDKKEYMEKAAQLFTSVPECDVDYAVEKAVERVIKSVVEKWAPDKIYANEEDFYLHLYENLKTTMYAIGLEVYSGRISGITFMSEGVRKYNTLPLRFGYSFRSLNYISQKRKKEK